MGRWRRTLRIFLVRLFGRRLRWGLLFRSRLLGRWLRGRSTGCGAAAGGSPVPGGGRFCCGSGCGASGTFAPTEPTAAEFPPPRIDRARFSPGHPHSARSNQDQKFSVLQSIVAHTKPVADPRQRRQSRNASNGLRFLAIQQSGQDGCLVFLQPHSLRHVAIRKHRDPIDTRSC